MPSLTPNSGQRRTNRVSQRREPVSFVFRRVRPGVAAWLVFGLHWGITALMIAVLVDELCRGVVNEAKFLSK